MRAGMVVGGGTLLFRFFSFSSWRWVIVEVEFYWRLISWGVVEVVDTLYLHLEIILIG